MFFETLYGIFENFRIVQIVYITIRIWKQKIFEFQLLS